MMAAPRSASATVERPSRTDPVVAGVSQVIGGPLGDHALTRRRFWTPIRIVLALACLAMAFNWVQKSPCRDGAWAEHEQYTKACYTDVLALYYAERLHEGAVPYLDHNVEYPVLTGALMGVIGLPVHALTDAGVTRAAIDALARVGLAEGGRPNEAKYFYDLTALTLGAFAVLAVWAIARTRPHRPWDAAMVALAPALLVTATVNWDLLAVGLTALAIHAWAKRRPVAAGVFFGLAAAAKFYPFLILVPLFLLCLRGRRLGEFVTLAGTAVVTWSAVNLPVYLAAPEAWATFYRFSSRRGVDWGTFWYIGSHFPRGQGPDGPRAGFEFFTGLAGEQPPTSLNTWSAALFGVCLLGIVALALFASRRPRLGALAFLVVAAFLLTNKVWSQQFVLWLVPLAVLARPRWGAFLAWQAAELTYFFGFYQILLRAAGGRSLLPETAFTLISLVRWGALAGFAALVVWECLRPNRDVVRGSGVDDPEGGPLDRAEDWTPPWSAWRKRVKREDHAVTGVGTA